jgi:ribonuclease G
VKLYDEEVPIFERFNIEKQIEQAFRRQVWLPSGGSIVLDETEAMISIDVNTGHHKPGRDQQETILRTNLEAASEICRQLRLRNIGGLLVLDFIDMRMERDRYEVFARMREQLKRDRAKNHVLPISQLGLMEMTRQRQSESMAAAVYDECPYCKGRGMVKSVLSLSVEIQRKIREVLRRHAGATKETSLNLRVLVHPDVLNRLRTQDERILVEMEKKYSGKLSFRADPSFHHEQFKIVNAASGEELT